MLSKLAVVKAKTKKLKKIMGSFGEKKSFALNDLDIKLRPYLNFKNGFFVEVGANDGVKQSNTLFFEKYYQWNGLLIEPIPELAQKCTQNRPNCIVENCALVSSDYPHETVEMIFCNLMSVVKGGLNSDAEKTHIQTGKRFLKENEQTYTVKVPAKTLTEVLDRRQVNQIDLLSLDVEGYEAEVLKGLDFDRHCPQYLLIEVHDEENIESVIGRYYESIAILNRNNAYSDILYKRKLDRSS